MILKLKARPLTLVLGSVLTAVLFFGFGLGASAGKEAIYRYLNVFAEVYSLVKGNYVDPVDEAVLLDGAYKGMVGGLDAFSGYLSKDEFLAFQREPGGGPADSGLEIVRRSGGAEIVAVRAGSQAEKAGIRPTDQIWNIDGIPARQLGLVQIRRSQRGALGSTVRLLIYHPKTQKREDLQIRRSQATGPAFESRVIDPKIGYLRIFSLERSDREALKGALNALKQKGATRLLLDLRDCVAGGVEEAVRASGLFVPPGAVVFLQDRGGARVPKNSSATPVWTLPVTVLQNGATAGGAEVLAAALKARIKATIVGETSYGLGSRQELIPLPAGDGLILSTEKFVSPGGETWNKSEAHEGGLKPDKEIASTSEERSGREPDGQLQKALEALRAPVAKAA